MDDKIYCIVCAKKAGDYVCDECNDASLNDPDWGQASGCRKSGCREFRADSICVFAPRCKTRHGINLHNTTESTE